MKSSTKLIEEKKWHEAKEQLKLELENNPNNAKAYYFLGDIYKHEQSYDQMNQAFESSLDISKKYAKKIALSHYELGVKYGNQHHWENMNNEFDASIKISSKYENQIQEARQKFDFIAFFENAEKTIGFYPMIFIHDGNEQRKFDKSFGTIFYNNLKFTSRLLTKEELEKISDQVDAVIYCVLQLYNEVSFGKKMAQSLITGLLGVSISEKNIVKMAIILVTTKNNKTLWTKAMEFEGAKAMSAEGVRTELSNKIINEFKKSFPYSTKFAGR